MFNREEKAVIGGIGLGITGLFVGGITGSVRIKYRYMAMQKI